MGILIILLSAIAYAMVAKRLSSTPITAPMVFLGVGLAMSWSGIMYVDDAERLLHIIAEVTLIILLFIDAAKIDLVALKKASTWPFRMLLIGLPLAVLLGTVFAALLFPDYPIALLALIAAVMAPTDAALGQAVVSNKRVPMKERQTLTVESGLNDGLAFPIILFFACLARSQEGVMHDGSNFLVFTLLQIGLGPLVGIFVGYVGAKMLLLAEKAKSTDALYEGVALLALAGSAYILADLVGGNGFIAAFVAGLVFGVYIKGHCRFVYEFSETEGQMLTWASFLFVGLALLPEALHYLDLRTTLYILGSLFIIRPLAIYISLLGTNAAPTTRLFFGWFGPRGLATALFALIITKDLNNEFSHAILTVAINAVWMSALLHGVTANVAAKWYGKKFGNIESKKN